jgi:phosphomannomutase
MSDLIISVSGLRGIIGESLNPMVASRYAAALASSLPTPPGEHRGLVVLGRDGRASGQVLVQAIAATLLGHGLDVVDLGAAATPTVGVQVRKLGAVAGMQVSASHNPKEYNGIKVFNQQGRVLPKSAGEKLLASYRESATKWVSVDALGTLCKDDQPHFSHQQLVLSTVDVERIRNAKFSVLLDSNHGAGSLLGRLLLDALGCQVKLLGEPPDGLFEHVPEPLAVNLQTVSNQVAHGTFDVAFCQDPDADRLAVIDERGVYIGEELTLALCLMQALPKLAKPGDVIVTNCATSSLSKHLAQQHNCRLLQSAVGEANVVDQMLAQGAVFGGEGNGGPIDPQVGFVRDSFVAMARILELMATTGKRVSQLVKELPPLSMVKDKAEMPASALPELEKHLKKLFSDAQCNTLDGLKLEWPDRWLLVRGSNTEPIVRFIAEAPTDQAARQLCEQARSIAEKI